VRRSVAARTINTDQEDLMATINRVVLVGNLTRDPELRSTANGTSVCRMRIACSTARRNKETGELDERPNYFDVSVFGASGEACARFLVKGRPVAVDGRLEWHDWTTLEGEQRQAVGIAADSVQFLAARQRGEQGDSETAEPAEAIAF
jgi:single-strand DNA-binding protein